MSIISVAFLLFIALLKPIGICFLLGIIIAIIIIICDWKKNR